MPQYAAKKIIQIASGGLLRLSHRPKKRGPKLYRSYIPMLSRVTMRLMQSCKIVCSTEKQGKLTTIGCWYMMNQAIQHQNNSHSNSWQPFKFTSTGLVMVWLLITSNSTEWSPIMTLWNLDWDFTERKASQPHAAVMSKDEGKRFRKLSLHYTVPNSQLAENVCHKMNKN